MPVLDPDKEKLVLIAQFLTRVAEGKHLDVQFETDEMFTPLEAALIVLDQIKEQEDILRNLHQEIKLFVQVQAVAICMTKGNYKMASEVLDRQFKESESNKYVRMKLAMIVDKKHLYHEFIQNFSYIKMLSKIKSYIDTIQKARQTAFLVKVATKVLVSKAEQITNTQPEKNRESDSETAERMEEDERSASTEYTTVQNGQTTDETISEIEEINSSSSNERTAQDIYEPTNINLNSVLLIHKKPEPTKEADSSIQRTCPQRRLFSLFQSTPWNPDKPRKRSLENRNRTISRRTTRSSSSQAPKKKQHWTWEEDALLKKGVKKYGVGNWKKILLHFEFNNRTGVMLKDRWRTMKNLNMVSSDGDVS
ncbi:telomeric repeat-binding factor 1 isoform 2-T2 [Discoglossus pictus]